MRDIAVTLIVFGSIPFILRSPFIGILMWSWLGFMNPHRLAWGFATSLPFAMIVALATLASLMMSREPKKIPWKRETILMAMFYAWMVVTTIMALYPSLAWEQLNKVTKIFLMVFVAMIVVNTPERLKQLVWVITLSIGFYGVKGGIFTITSGGGFHVRGPAGSFIDGNNEIGLALIMTVPLFYYLSTQVSRKAWRVALLASMVLTALAALGTQSRGALLGMAGMGVFFWLKSRNKFATAVLLIAVTPLLLMVMPDSWYERMASVKTYENDPSAMGRIHAWKFAFYIASQRLFGGGFACFQPEAFYYYVPEFESAHDSHSIYFGILGHHGWPGLALYLLLIFCTWMSASSTIRITRRYPDLKWLRDMMAMTQVSMIAYLTAGAFLGMQYFDYFYNLILIIVAGRVILERYLAAQREREEDKPIATGMWPARPGKRPSPVPIAPGMAWRQPPPKPP